MKEKRFNGEIGMTLQDSRLSFAENSIGKKPNIVYIVLDDVGFAQLGCYGSDIHTPNIDKLAQSGLRYNNFHTTAICSSTRSALLTGANHHTVGFANVSDTCSGFPNNQGWLKPEYATIAEILQEHDYASFAVGKWHLLPLDRTEDQGPYQNWPLQKGFDKFYGFMEGFTDQYHPDLIKDNSIIQPPKSPKEGYHLSEDLSEQAVHYIYQHTTAYPEKPFFLYLAYGAAHSPHQAPKEYIDRYKGKFDDGWDIIRERWFENQKKLGIIPQDTVLTPRNPLVKAWDELSEDEKKVYARYMEVFAGFLEHTDEQIGKVIDYLDVIGQRDNTVIVLLSDNGTSAEGGQEGHFVHEKSLDILKTGTEVQVALEHYDEMGSEYSSPHYPIGWANVGNTPFQWYKSWTHAGGIKDPLIISYPDYIQERGGIRTQYHHVTDITPTILEILNIEKPVAIKGVQQQPFQGVSMKYSFNGADEPTRKHIQYYEMVGNRTLWKDGWKVVANHFQVEDYKDDIWELYHTDEDYSEARDIADKYPDKVREMVSLWFAEAGKNGVFPLGSGSHFVTTHSGKIPQIDYFLKEQSFVYKNIREPFRISSRMLAFNQRNNRVTINLEHSAKDEGIIYQAGNRFGGYILYIKGNCLHYTYNYHLEEFYRVVTDKLPEGKIKIQVDTILTKSGGEVVLYINGLEMARTEIKKFVYMFVFKTALKDGISTSVDLDIDLPFEYSGKINEIEFRAAPQVVTSKEMLDEFFRLD